MGRYILVTPAKNEEENIDRLVYSVVNQTITPILWIVVDDNSTDKTYKKLMEYEKSYDFMKVVKYPIIVNEYDVGIHGSLVCRFGFDYAMNYAEKNKINFEYIGLLDADISPERDYFEKLIRELENDPELGLVSGEILSWNGKEYINESEGRKYPRGGARLWKKDCFLKTGGYLITYSADTVSNIKALMKGYKIKRVPQAKAFQSRLTSSVMGLYKGWKKYGESAYYLHRPLSYALLKFLYLIGKGKFKEGFGFMNGYMISLISRREKINDDDVINYYKNINLFDYIKNRRRGLGV